MPYTIRKNDDGEFCVYKADEQGDPMGESMGCHKTQAEASDQIGAVEASESGAKMVQRYTQDEAQFQEISSDLLQSACKTCRFFDSGASMCLIVENYPLEISEISVCGQYTARPDGDESESAPLPVVIVEERAITEPEPPEEPEPELQQGYIAPASNKTGFFTSLKEKWTPGYKPGNTVFQGTDGQRYMFIVTSNSYQDRQMETIASKALQRYVDSCWLAEDYFRSDNVLQVWHTDALTVGDIVWADMAGPFLLEVAKERQDVISKAAWDFWESEKGRKDLGASHRYLYRKADKDPAGTVHLISKFETSPLPRQQAAANLLTFSGVIPMSKSKDEYLDEMFGIEGVAEMLKEGPQKLAEALAAKGVQAKSVDEPTPAEATESAAVKFSALLLQMIDDLADTHARLDAQTQLTEAKALEQTIQVTALETQLKALASDNAGLREAMKQQPRASEHPDTVVTDTAAKAAIQNQKTAYDPMFPGMQVPMEG